MFETELPAKIRATIGAYVKGFADSNLDAICELFHPDATVEDPVGTPKKTGDAEIRAFYQMALGAAPKLTVTGTPVISGAFSATPITATVDMDGNTISIDFISVMSYELDGRIQTMTAYFDPAAIGG